MRLHGSLRLGALGRGIALLVLLLAAGCSAMSVVSEGGDSNLMLQGYDPVTYFTIGRPVRGSMAIKTEHLGATYRFATEANRRMFITSPDRYVPQFGGFCANGMAYSVPVAADAEVFKIIDGKLHLFGGIRSKLYFEMNQERNLRLANHYWETEVKDSNWRFHYLKRLIFRVPHYKTNAELAEEYERRFGKKPG